MTGRGAEKKRLFDDLYSIVCFYGENYIWLLTRVVLGLGRDSVIAADALS